jgi:serine/threonine protein kinase
LDDIWSGEPGLVLDGKYRIDALLGQGGMGAVYRATHLGTTRTVAVKVIHPRFSQDPEFVERFRREAEAAGRLRHPNVVDVTDFGFAPTRTGQVAYLVMEYLDGQSLADALKEGQLSTGSVVEILEQVCSAVADAHRLGIVHRDLKPDNIWLEPNRRGGFTVKVLDFGLAKLTGVEVPSTLTNSRPGPEDMTGAFPAADSGLMTRAGSVTGTPLYMSPEQCRGEQVDARSDIYSLGVVAYRMLAGAPPFSGDALQLIKLHCEAPPPNLAERGRRLPRRLSALVMSALAKNPADRPDSAAGFGSALRASAEGSGALLRHAVSLYSEHFPVFFKLSLLASVPLIVFAAVLVAIDRDSGGENSSLAAVLIFLGTVAANLFAYAMVAGAAIPLVVQLSAAPLKQIHLHTALHALKHRAGLDSHFTLQLDDNWQPRQVGIQFGMSGESMLFQLLTIVITPLTAIMTGQLYLKARHAGGETIDTR